VRSALKLYTPMRASVRIVDPLRINAKLLCYITPFSYLTRQSLCLLLALGHDRLSASSARIEKWSVITCHIYIYIYIYIHTYTYKIVCVFWAYM